MRKNFRKAALSTICMLVVAVMSLTGATYAWFTTGTNSEVTGMHVEVAAATGGILVSENGTNWTQNLALSTASVSEVKPVSTIGATGGAFAFFTADAEVNDNITTIKTKASDASHYIAQKLYLKNDSTDEITVNLGTADVPATLTRIKQTEGDLTNGYLAGRIGISYVETYTIDAATGNVTTTAAEVDGTVCGSTGFGIYSNNETTTSYKGVKTETADFASVTAGDHLDDVNLVSGENFKIVIPAQSIVEVTVYVWMEGQDAECINENAKAKFDVILNFNRVISE